MATEKQTNEYIVSLAEQAVGELLEAIPALKIAPPTERSISIMQALNADQGSLARLEAAFLDDTSFGALRDGWIQLRYGFGMAVQSH